MCFSGMPLCHSYRHPHNDKAMKMGCLYIELVILKIGPLLVFCAAGNFNLTYFGKS